MAVSARHETRALLRAHLAAASSYRHSTARCSVCHHLLRLAMDGAPTGAPEALETVPAPSTAPEAPEPRRNERQPFTA